MRGRAFAWRRLAAVALLAVLPACTNGGGAIFDPAAPTDGARLTGSLSAGSRAGDYLAGRFAQNSHDLQPAADYLLRALAADPENVDVLQRAYLALAVEGRLTEAADLGRRLLKFDGEASVAALLLAEQAARQGRWAEAEALVANLPKRGLNTFMVPLVTAWAKMGQGNADGALEALAPLSQNSHYAALHDFHAALISDLADRRKAAEQSFHSLLGGTGGQTLRPVEAAVSFYRRIGQPERANELISRYRQDHPDTLSEGFQPENRRLVETARAGMAEVFFGAAGSLRQGNAPDLALIFARLAVDLQPDFPLAQVTAADLLQNIGRLDEADAIYRQISPSAAIYPAAELRLAANLDQLGDVDGAIKVLEELAGRGSAQPEVLMALGDVLRSHKRWDEAVAVYDRAAPLLGKPQPNHWVFYYSRGIALERAKQWQRAEADFLKALELQPDQPHVLNYLGYSWIEQGMNVERARKMIEKAVQQQPTDGFIVDSLGWVLFRSGDYRRAVEELQRAVELHPEDPTINDHLGDALWAAGRPEEAKFQWRRALVFHPEPDLKAEIDHKLEAGLPITPIAGPPAVPLPGMPVAPQPVRAPAAANSKATVK